MTIVVANLKSECGQSTCAVNLACELAGTAKTGVVDRWEGTSSVLLVTMPADVSDPYCASEHLPVSCEHLPSAELNRDRWTQGVLELAADLDYVVMCNPPHLRDATELLVAISDLVVVPCSAADLEATATMIGMIRSARSARADGGPKCLLVPTRVGPGTPAARELTKSLEKLGEPVGPPVHQRTAFAGAFVAGRWIGDFAPDGVAHADIRALATCVKRTAELKAVVPSEQSAG